MRKTVFIILFACLGLSGEASVQNPDNLVSTNAQTINYNGFNKVSYISETVGADNYNSKAGFIAGVGYGFGFGGVGNFSFNSNAGSLGINYSSNGGFSANIGGLQYNGRTGWTANPSVGVSYTAKSGLYGTFNVNDPDYEIAYDDPIPYDMEAAYKFMLANGLADDLKTNSEWQNLYADGRIPNSDYSYESGKVLDKKGNTVNGITYFRGKNGFLGLCGKQLIDIYLYQTAFRNPEKLYLTIQHELVHVNLFSMGYYDNERHEGTAYKQSQMQADAWGLSGLANEYNFAPWKLFPHYSNE